jgi:hypothetical protein
MKNTTIPKNNEFSLGNGQVPKGEGHVTWGTMYFPQGKAQVP